MLLSCQQCRQFDRIAIEEFGIPGIVLMENAGARCVGELERRGRLGSGVILCGGGNNGGDGFVIARHLLNRGANLKVILLTDPERLTGDAKINFDVLTKMDTSIHVADTSWDVARFASEFDEFSEAQLIVDAMLGTGANGALREPYVAAVDAANQTFGFRIAIDIPSGLDGDTGATTMAFKADLTLTFIAWKTGFENPLAKQWLGEVAVIDIGAPKSIYQRFEPEG